MMRQSCWHLALFCLLVCGMNSLYAISWQNIPDSSINSPTVQNNLITKDEIIAKLQGNIQSSPGTQFWFYVLDPQGQSEEERLRREQEEERIRQEQERLRQQEQERIRQQQERLRQEEQERLRREQEQRQRQEQNSQGSTNDHMTLLNLINRERVAQGRDPLVLNSELNSISEGHSIDMRDRDFFDHNNPDGQSAQDRANEAGFTDPVGENIAISPNVSQSHVQFRNSPGHYRNYMNAMWRRVGFGFAYKQTQFGNIVYVTEMFSTRDFQDEPLNQQEINQIRIHALQAINQVNQYVANYHQGLSSALTNWYDNHRNTNIFSFLGQQGFRGAMRTTSFRTTNPDPEAIRNSIVQNGFLRSFSQYTYVGLSIAIEGEWIQITAIYFTPSN